MSDTPRTDEILGGPYGAEWTGLPGFARQLERELNAAKTALSGRTVSCSNCNALAAENAELRAQHLALNGVLKECLELLKRL